MFYKQSAFKIYLKELLQYSTEQNNPKNKILSQINLN